MLHDILSLRLWYLDRIDESQSSAALNDSTRARLLDVASSLIKQEQFWTAKTVFQIALFDGLFDSEPQGNSHRWINLQNALERVQETDESTFESRLTKITIAQKVCEEVTLCMYIYLGRAGIYSELDRIRLFADQVQAKMRQRFPGEDYGNRCAVYDQYVRLLDVHLGRSAWFRWGKEITMPVQAVEEVRALQNKANFYDDRATHQALNILCHLLAKRDEADTAWPSKQEAVNISMRILA